MTSLKQFPTSEIIEAIEATQKYLELAKVNTATKELLLSEIKEYKQELATRK